MVSDSVLFRNCGVFWSQSLDSTGKNIEAFADEMHAELHNAVCISAIYYASLILGDMQRLA